MFGTCGACQAPLEPPSRGPAQELPRLQAIARRIVSWDAAGLPAGDARHVVCLAPQPEGRGAGTSAAESVGSVLGTTPADGAQRLASPLPEPLVRVPDAASAEAVERALLDAAGLEAFSLPLRELLAPLVAFEAERVALGDTTTYVDPQGAERTQRFGEPRLVITAPFLAARRAGAVPPGTPRLTPTRPTLRLGKKTPEAAMFVFLGRDPLPVLVRETAVKDWSSLASKMTLVPAQNVEILARELGQGGGELRALPRELGQEPWLVRLPGLEDLRENAPLVALGARLLHRHWVLRGRWSDSGAL